MSATSSEPLLETLARVEIGAIQKLEAAEKSAQDEIAAARQEAAAFQAEEARKLAAEIQALRRDAEAARDAERAALVKANAEQLDRLRAEAASRLPEIVQEVVALVLSGRGESA